MSKTPGELLSRQEILHGVWDGTAVSDDALKRAVRVLRKTLGDDASSPRFIETLPKKGYRLIAPVSIADKVELPSRKRSRGRRYMAALLLVAGVVACWFFFLRGEPAPPRTNRPTVAVLQFDNLDGNPETAWLRAGLADMLITDLAQSPHLEVLNPERLYTVFGNGEETGEKNGAVHELAAHSGVDILVQGSFVAADGVLRLNARVVDTATGRIMTAEKADGLNGTGIFETVDELTRCIQPFGDSRLENFWLVDFRVEIPFQECLWRSGVERSEKEKGYRPSSQGRPGLSESNQDLQSIRAIHGGRGMSRDR